jgi:hypothetical protein
MRGFRFVRQDTATHVALLLAVAAAPIALGERPRNPTQTPKPLAFEAASITLTPPEFQGSRAFAPSPGNNLSLRGMSLKDLIQWHLPCPQTL